MLINKHNVFRYKPREIEKSVPTKKLKNQYKPMYVYVYTYKNTEKVNFHEYTKFNFTLVYTSTHIKNTYKIIKIIKCL